MAEEEVKESRVNNRPGEPSCSLELIERFRKELFSKAPELEETAYELLVSRFYEGSSIILYQC